MKKLFLPIFHFLISIYEYYIKLSQPYFQKKALFRIRNKKGPINVLFFVLGESNWKYESVYKLMVKDPFFNPMIIVCPEVNQGIKYMKETMDSCYGFFKNKGYVVYKALNYENMKYLNTRELNPDIIFYENPYRGLINWRYYIYRQRKVLTCYVNYFYNNSKFAWTSSLAFHKILWKYFVECEKVLQIMKPLSKDNSRNCVVVGYPTYDEFQKKNISDAIWKQKDAHIKRVIWAPHHSIVAKEGALKYSTFLYYYKFMRTLPQIYQGKIQFVFKPHPLLKIHLYNHKDWGKEKTDEYFDFWEKQSNTNYTNGEYIDLFLTSDALIHDCGSFTIEYLYTKKPTMYLTNSNNGDQFNAIGKEALDCHYLANTEELIIQFLDKVVCQGQDKLIANRNSFYENYLLPPNGLSVAENITNEIKSCLCK